MKHSIISLFISLIAIGLKAQNNKGIIRGSIQNSKQELLSKISVQLESTNQGSITNDDGFFEIKNISPGNYTLIISSVGYKLSKEK